MCGGVIGYGGARQSSLSYNCTGCQICRRYGVGWLMCYVWGSGWMSVGLQGSCVRG